MGLSPEEKADLEELIVASRSDSAKQLTDKQVLLETVEAAERLSAFTALLHDRLQDNEPVVRH